MSQRISVKKKITLQFIKPWRYVNVLYQLRSGTTVPLFCNSSHLLYQLLCICLSMGIKTPEVVLITGHPQVDNRY